MKKVVLLLLLLAGAVVARSQELNYEYADVYVLDAMTSKPIEGVLAMVANRDVGESDSNGRLVFSRYVRNISPTLIFFKGGYALDSITLPYVPDTVYLKPLTGVLEEAVITNRKSDILLKRGREYVFDYEFVDTDILVASRIGNTHRLALVNNNGDVLMEKKINIAFNELYKSCIGEYYLVTYYSIHRLIFDYASEKIVIDKPKPLTLLSQLKTCVLYRNDIYYYKLINRQLRSAFFGLSKKGDTQMLPFRSFWQKEELLDIVDGKIQIQKYLEQGDLQSARILSSVMQLVDKNSFKRMNVPLFIKGDTILVFDLDKGNIHFYSSIGIFLKSQPLLFDYKDLRINKLIQDPISESIYAYRSKPNEHTLLGIDVEKGQFTKPVIMLEKPFPQQVQIKDGDVYYLWQNERKKGKQQLYIQRNM